MVVRGRTKVTELRERIVKLGGVPKGRTVADLLDELEALMTSGGMTPEQVKAYIAEAVAEQLPDLVEPGSLSDDDLDDIFGD